MKYLKRFNESLSYPNTKYKDISNDDINSFSNEELNRILICHNDGQGDTNCYTFADARNTVSVSDVKYKGSYVKGSDIVDGLKPSEIIDIFCEDMNANMTSYIYFDVEENQYKYINWT